MPFVFFSYQCLVGKAPLSSFMVGFYVYPLLILSSLTLEGLTIPGLQISESSANVVRLGIHGAVFIVLALAVLRKYGKLKTPYSFIWASFALTGMLVSLLVNQSDADAMARVLLTWLMMFNIFVLLPSVVSSETYYTVLARYAVGIALYCGLFSAYTIWQHGFYPAWSIRLGRPWNPNVLSYLIVTGLVVSFLANVRGWMRFGLLVMLLLLASRLDAFLGIVLFLYMGLRDSRWRLATVVSLSFVFIAGITVFIQLMAVLPYNELPFTRTRILSGRDEIWTRGLEQVTRSPWFGIGDRAYVKINPAEVGVSEMRVHNMPLEMAMSYGLPVSILSMMVYVFIGRGIYLLSRKRGDPFNLSTIGLALVGLIFSHALFTTAFWTNLGDGSIILSMIFIVPMSAYGEYFKKGSSKATGHMASTVTIGKR